MEEFVDLSNYSNSKSENNLIARIIKDFNLIDKNDAKSKFIKQDDTKFVGQNDSTISINKLMESNLIDQNKNIELCGKNDNTNSFKLNLTDKIKNTEGSYLISQDDIIGPTELNSTIQNDTTKSTESNLISQNDIIESTGLNSTIQNDTTKSTELNLISQNDIIESTELNSTIQNDTTKSTESNIIVLDINNINKWIFELNWDISNQLIQLLSDFTALLITGKKTILIDDEELIKSKDNLCKLLAKLPLKLNKTKGSKLYNEKLFTNLDYKFRSEIIDHLMKIEHVVINYEDVSEENKKFLIEKNRNLICKLIGLTAEFKVDNLIDEENSELLKGNITEISGLKNDMQLLRIQVNNLRQQLIEEKLKFEKQLNDNRSVTFNCILKDVKEFFEENNEFYSEKFSLLNLDWKINIESKLSIVDNNRYLGFFLCAFNEKDFENKIKWQCKTFYELRLKSNLPNKPDMIKKVDYTFSDKPDWRYDKFISVKELFNPENGFVKDNCINVEVCLIADRVIRRI